MLPIEQSIELYDQEQRIRAALGLEKGHLPMVDNDWLRKYFEYLAANLSLPFNAQYTEEFSITQIPEYYQVEVVAILRPGESSGQEYHGLICKVRKGEQEKEVPLVDLEVDEDNPNFQLIEDYWYWIWNWRFDPRI